MPKKNLAKVLNIIASSKNSAPKFKVGVPKNCAYNMKFIQNFGLFAYNFS